MASVEHHRRHAVLPHGSGRVSADLPGERLDIFTYRPRYDATLGVLILFDGLRRNASSMRDKAIMLSERTGLIALAPLMDHDRFPKWRYDRAGVFRHRELQPQAHWTAPLLQSLIDWARELIGATAPKIYMFGHSAGGQMLSRICAYSPLSGVDGFVITNPSSHVLPLLDEPVPYGFKRIFPAGEADAALRNYLTSPITIFLGQQDTGDHNLSRSKGAMRQGSNRLERGRFVYATGEAVAKANGLVFNWRLVEAPEVGHSSRAMLDSAQCCEALGVTFEA